MSDERWYETELRNLRVVAIEFGPILQRLPCLDSIDIVSPLDNDVITRTHIHKRVLIFNTSYFNRPQLYFREGVISASSYERGRVQKLWNMGMEFNAHQRAAYCSSAGRNDGEYIEVDPGRSP